MSSPGNPDPGRFGVLRNSLRAILGAPMFTLRHVVGLKDVKRRTEKVDLLSEAPPVPSGGRGAQTSEDGHGPLVMRTYTVAIVGSTMDGPALIRCLADDPNRFTPQAIAGFVRDDKPVRALEEGAEVVVEIPSPWNAPVRVQRTDDMLLLETLEDHMEAGHIRFDTVPDGDGFDFRIRSWATAGDVAFLLLHVGAKLAWEMQTAMWVDVCRRAVEISGGRRSGPIRVESEIVRDGAEPRSESA